MSWRITIEHRTTHRYAHQVEASYNEARVSPLSAGGQVCISSTVEVEPGPRLFQYRDYWGTLVTSFDLQVPHAELLVRAQSTVETTLATPANPDATWDLLGSGPVLDRFAELLAPTPYVPLLSDAANHLPRRASPHETAQTCAGWAHERLEYEAGATDVTTSAAEALDRRRGVCQDFAHVTLGILRTLGIPCRYVSGYLHPKPDAEIGETVSGQSHAWVEWWCGAWVQWDPTHDGPVGERHVAVGRGRDYGDVAPLKGVYQGAPAVAHNVTVALTRNA